MRRLPWLLSLPIFIAVAARAALWVQDLLTAHYDAFALAVYRGLAVVIILAVWLGPLTSLAAFATARRCLPTHRQRLACQILNGCWLILCLAMWGGYFFYKMRV